MKTATKSRAKKFAKPVPACVAFMGCLCAGHARGNPVGDACDTREETQADKLRAIGKTAYESIAEMVEATTRDTDGDDGMSVAARIEKAQQAIQEDPLSVEVRSAWVSPGDEMVADEFKILLGTGGPAVRIVGELNQYREPMSAQLETQDWGTPWTEYQEADESVLLAYCREFYFGT